MHLYCQNILSVCPAFWHFAVSSASNFLLLWSGKHFSDMKTLKQTISSFSKQKIWKWFPTIFSIMYERTLLPAALWWATGHRSAELGRPLINDVLNSLPKLNILFYLLHCYWIQLSRLTIFTFSMELIKLSHIFFFRFDYLRKKIQLYPYKGTWIIAQRQGKETQTTLMERFMDVQTYLTKLNVKVPFYFLMFRHISQFWVEWCSEVCSDVPLSFVCLHTIFCHEFKYFRISFVS